MNKILKIFIVILGATYSVFSIFIPIAVALLLIGTGVYSDFNNIVLIVIGIMASMYKAISIGFIR